MTGFLQCNNNIDLNQSNPSALFLPQWTISELACYTYSLVAVPLYDTLGTEAIGYIIEKGTNKFLHHMPRTRNWKSSTAQHFVFASVSAAISTVICDVAEKARMILDCIGGQGKTVKTIVLMEAFDKDLVSRGTQSGVEILTLKEFEVNKGLTCFGSIKLYITSSLLLRDFCSVCFSGHRWS